MRSRPLTWAAALALGASIVAAPAALAGTDTETTKGKDQDPMAGQVAVRSVEFVGMDAPATPEQKASVYSSAKAKVTYANGKSTLYDLAYHQLMATGQTINGKVVGGLVDAGDKPLTDDAGPIASDAPDGNSLMKLPGLAATKPAKSDGLALVTQYEYRSKPPMGAAFTEKDYWSRLPATMSLARIDQDKRTGALSVTDYANISFAAVNGLWVPCAASLTPWNTHLGSEEYEPDAKTREGLAKASDTGDDTDINGFSTAFFGDPKKANAYHYGLVPEVKVQRDGSTSVEKHYAMGRIARELADIQPDGRTAYG